MCSCIPVCWWHVGFLSAEVRKDDVGPMFGGEVESVSLFCVSFSMSGVFLKNTISVSLWYKISSIVCDAP